MEEVKGHRTGKVLSLQPNLLQLCVGWRGLGTVETHLNLNCGTWVRR